MAARQVKTRASKRHAGTSAPSDGGVSSERMVSLLDSFLDSLRTERGASENTTRNYRIDLEAYMRWCERNNVNPLKASHRDLRAYLGELDAARYARSTMNRRLSSLRSFYRWANLTGAIEADPAEVLFGAKRGQHLPHVLQADDMARLLLVHSAFDERGNAREQTVADMRDQAILEFLYACGARISETSGLCLGDVDFSSRLVKLFGKGRKERIVPLHDLCVEAMRKYLKEARPKLLEGKQATDRFFISNRGNPMSADSMRKMFKSTVEAAGLDATLSPHDMRHTFATDLLEGNADLRSVQEMLGHASLSTTQIYTHLSTGRLKDAHHQAHPRA